MKKVMRAFSQLNIQTATMKEYSHNLVLCLLLFIAAVKAAGTIKDIHATFNSIGIIVEIGDADDPQRLGTAALWYKKSGTNVWREGHPLVRTRTNRYVGSVFFVEEGTSYDVKVQVSTDNEPLFASVTTRQDAELNIPTSSKTYYVSPDGNSTDCTSASPCNINTAIKVIQPGEEILLADGVYHEGEIQLFRPGERDKPIVIRGSREAIFDGSDPEPYTWELVSGTVYKTTVRRNWPHLVVANGIRLWPYGNLTDLEQLNCLWPGFYAEDGGTDLYINLAGQPQEDPNKADVKIALQKWAFLSNSFVRYYGFTIRYYGREVYGVGIWLRYLMEENVIANMKFFITDSGVGLESYSERTVVQDNEFYDTRQDMDWHSVKTYWYYYNALEVGGIEMFSRGSGGRGIVVRRNNFEGFFDTMTLSDAPRDDLTLELDIYDNNIIKGSDDAITVDGSCFNCRIWNNYVHNSQTGVSMAPVDQGPVFVMRNLIVHESKNCQPFKFNSGYGQRGNFFIYHNTAVTLGDYAIPFAMYGGVWDMLRTRNNIFIGNASYLLLNDFPDVDRPMDLDYNIYWRKSNGTVQEIIKFRNYYTSIEDFKNSNQSQELNGMVVEPEFEDWISFVPTVSAPQVDKGVLIPGVNDYFYGSAPDIGAIEYYPPGQAPVVSRSPKALGPKGSFSSASLVMAQLSAVITIAAVLIL